MVRRIFDIDERTGIYGSLVDNGNALDADKTAESCENAKITSATLDALRVCSRTPWTKGTVLNTVHRRTGSWNRAIV